MADATFEVYEDAEGKYRWRLRHDNGEIIADSGQGYSTIQKCKQGMMSVKRNAGGAPYKYGAGIVEDAIEKAEAADE